MRGTELSFGLLLKYGLCKSGYPKTVDPNLVSPVVKSVAHDSVLTQVLNMCIYVFLTFCRELALEREKVTQLYSKKHDFRSNFCSLEEVDLKLCVQRKNESERNQ